MSQWKTLKLPECLEKAPKANKIPKNKFLQSGTYPVISQEKGLVNGYWNDPKDVVPVDRPLVVFGDHTTVLKLVDFDFVVGADGIKILKPKAFLDAGYLHYFLLSRPLNGLGYARHYRLLKELSIAFPSLDEQKRIVAMLDEAFEGIDTVVANTEKNLGNARELFESYLNKIFSQLHKELSGHKLENMCERITKGSSPKWQGIEYVDNPGVLFVTSENVGRNRMVFNRNKYVDLAFNKKDSKSILKNGDVLTNIVGASIGRTSVFDRDDLANINQAVCLIRCDPGKLVSFYLSYLLNSPFFRKVLHENEIDNARANLSLGFFKNLSIPAPKIERQLEIVEEVKSLEVECDRLDSIYQHKFNALSELKQSLLHKAFSGELTPTEAETAVEEATA